MNYSRSFMFSALPTDSISIHRSKNSSNNIDRVHSNRSELSHYLFEDQNSYPSIQNSPIHTKKKFSGFEHSPLNTIREFDDVDENVLTLRDDETLMCVNCYECIILSEVDSHSFRCLYPTHDTSDIYDKINKLLNTIRERKNDADDQHVYPLLQLEEIAKCILERTIDFSTISTRLKRLMSSTQLTFILIIAQRLIKLSEAVPEYSQDKTAAKTVLIVDMIDSILHSSEVKDSFISMYSELSNLSAVRFKDQNSQDAMEKFFYNQCIKKKVSLSPDNPLRNLSIFLLYEECISKCIPMADWGKFIDAAFSDKITVTS